MRNPILSSIMILLFSIFITACRNKEPLSEDVSAEITMQGVEAAIGEDACLWKSDGMTVGTVKVKDINATCDNERASNLIAIGDTLFFSTSGHQLWSKRANARWSQTLCDREFTVSL